MDTQSVCLSIHLCRSVCVIGWIRSVDPSLPTALPLSRGQWADRSLARAILKRLAHRQTHTHSVSRSLLCVCLSVCLSVFVCLDSSLTHSLCLCLCVSVLLCVFIRSRVHSTPRLHSLCLSPRFILISDHTHSLSIVCVCRCAGRERSILVSSILSQPALPVWRHWADRSDPHSTILKRLALSHTILHLEHTLFDLCLCVFLSHHVCLDKSTSPVCMCLCTLSINRSIDDCVSGLCLDCGSISVCVRDRSLSVSERMTCPKDVCVCA